MSHLYDADEIRDNHIDNQIKIFKEMIEIIEEN
jgi:alanine racemase